VGDAALGVQKLPSGPKLNRVQTFKFYRSALTGSIHGLL